MSAGGQLAGLELPELDRLLRPGAEPGSRPRRQPGDDQGLQRLARRRVVRRVPRALHPVRHPAAVRRRGGGEGGAPPRRQGLSRGHLLGEPRRPRHAEHPHRRTGIRCSPRAATPAPCSCCHIGSSSKAASTSPDAPPPVAMNLSSGMAIYTLGDLLWADFWHRFPDAAVLAHRGRHRVDPVLPLAGRAHARPAQRVDPARAAAGAVTRPSCSTSASCVCFINDRVGVKLLDEFSPQQVCWESDYPHSDSSWPEAPEKLWELVADLDPDIVDRITHRNAMRRLPVRPVLGPADASSAPRRRCAPRRPTSTPSRTSAASPTTPTAPPGADDRRRREGRRRPSRFAR